MTAYLTMIGLPAAAAIAGARRFGLLFFLVSLVFFVLIGWRYQVGMDWPNYVRMLAASRAGHIHSEMVRPEIGFDLLLFVANATGGGITLVNAFSGAVFCIGLFILARRMSEPFLAITVATPILAVAVAMSATRQAIALGIFFFTLAQWQKWQGWKKLLGILAASLFHVSALVNLVFLVLQGRLSAPARALVVACIAGGVLFSSSRFDRYAINYVAGRRVLEAPGAFYHIALIAVPSLIYWIFRHHWWRTNGRVDVFHQMAIASMLCFPAAFISSVGADRISFYFWPVVMYLAAGWPALIGHAATRAAYRLFVVVASIAILVIWLLYANSSVAWFPYDNVLWRGLS